jgi:predicted nucleic acid-binding protein
LLVVADTSPLISLAVIDKLEILDDLFEKIVIPEVVWQELIKYVDILSIPQVKKYQNRIISIKHATRSIANIDKGESEAIFLFEEIHADQLLIDDHEARKIAESRHIPCLGTLGVLIRAKQKGLLPELRSLFIQLIAKNRFYAVSLLNDILSAVNEPTL